MAEKDLEQSIREWLDNGYLHEAFERVLCRKIRTDGYIDIYPYFEASLKAMRYEGVSHKIHQARYAKLVEHDSKLCELYRSYVIENRDQEATNEWTFMILDEIDSPRGRSEQLSPNEAEALVDIVLSQTTMDGMFLLLGNIFDHERQRAIDKSFGTAHTIYHQDDMYIIYDKSVIIPFYIDSIVDLMKYISDINSTTLFYRGHEQVNHVLQPKVMWSQRSRESERKIYQEMMVSCPSDLLPRHSHLERLAMMQHYGLPTRLLDVTRNPLVALYMACKGSPDQAGEIFVLTPHDNEIKYHDSDIVSVLASLALFDENDKIELQELVTSTLCNYCDTNCDCEVNSCHLRKNCFNAFSDFNKERIVHRLVHEVRSEKPGFSSEIVPCQLLKKYLVHALKDNARIIRQDGAFILSGLDIDGIGNKKARSIAKRINEFKYKVPTGDDGYYAGTGVYIISHKYKQKILDDLNNISINHQSLMPEIADVASDLTAKYC